MTRLLMSGPVAQDNSGKIQDGMGLLSTKWEQGKTDKLSQYLDHALETGLKISKNQRGQV